MKSIMKKKNILHRIPVVFFAAVVFLLYACTAKAQSAAPPGTTAKAFDEAGLRLLSNKVSPMNFSLPLLKEKPKALAPTREKWSF